MDEEGCSKATTAAAPSAPKNEKKVAVEPPQASPTPVRPQAEDTSYDAGEEARAARDAEPSVLSDTIEVDDKKREKADQEPCARPYLSVKYRKDAKRYWDMFYQRNTVNFFKDRHWLVREFPILLQQENSEGARPVLFEIGCGVGNTVFPVRQENPALFVHACDLSPRAVDFVKAHEEYSTANCHAFQCDLREDDVVDHIPPASVDIVTALFVLSAMSLDEMKPVVTNIGKILRKGGVVCFRDYGLYDHAMLRFKKGHKLEPQLYYRQDGTRAFYFEPEQVKDLFESCGFEVSTLGYVSRETVNKKEGLHAGRVFVQGEFKKL